MSRRSHPAAEPADCLVLCYHAVSDGARSKLSVPSLALRRQLSTLLDSGYESVTLEQSVHGVQQSRAVVVTFDDAERNVLDRALPMLAELGVHGTVFVPVAWVGARAMSWDDLATLAEAGWEIGSHTLTHPRLPTLGDAMLERELRGSREAIEDALGLSCRSIAYPYGEVDARVRAAAETAGFTCGCTTGGGVDCDDPLLVPRVGVDGRDSLLMFRVKTSREGRALRSSLIRGPLGLAGRAVRTLTTALQAVLRQT